MKKILWIVFVISSITPVSFADTNTTVKKVISATRGDIKIIEASEKIRYISQKLVKEYLFYYKYSGKSALKQAFISMLVELNKDFRTIVLTTKDSDTKDILDFLSYSKDQIDEIIEATPSEENAALMLDYSETFLEGADSIAETHKYDFSVEERMLMTTKEMEYLLERISKYYMALNVGFKSTTYKEAMQEAIDQFEENLAKVDLYNYPAKEAAKKEILYTTWEANRIFFEKEGEVFIPSLMKLSVDYMEKLLIQLAQYHNKNQ